MSTCDGVTDYALYAEALDLAGPTYRMFLEWPDSYGTSPPDGKWITVEFRGVCAKQTGIWSESSIVVCVQRMAWPEFMREFGRAVAQEIARGAVAGVDPAAPADDWARDAEARGLHAFAVETIGPLVGWVVAASVQRRATAGRYALEMNATDGCQA